jgi:nicotinamidase-related amidase
MNNKKIQELKRLLIIVDMVNGFVKEGALADPYIKNIIPENIKLIEMILKNNEGLAFIKDSHEEGCREFERYPIHCVKGTYESELISELSKYDKKGQVYEKNSTSTLFAPNFISDIKKLKSLKEVIIAGCCTDICIMNLAIPLQNYFDQNNNEIEIIIPVNAIETYDAPWHNREEYNLMAYKMMEQSGIKLVKKYGGDKYGN